MKIESMDSDIVVAKAADTVSLIIKTHNDGFDIFDVASMSCLQGYINISFDDLRKKFGEPTDGDGYKVDAEWEITDGVRAATIYNYKNGHNYNGMEGIERTSIVAWHIGGSDRSAVELLQNIFPNHDVRSDI